MAAKLQIAILMTSDNHAAFVEEKRTVKLWSG